MGRQLLVANVPSATSLPAKTPVFAVKADNYYVHIEHRNHLGMTTAARIAVGATPVITSPASASLATGSAFSLALAATGDSAILFALDGTLPPGLSFDPTTGLISGTIRLQGAYFLNVTATNPVGSQQQALMLTVVLAAVFSKPIVSG